MEFIENQLKYFNSSFVYTCCKYSIKGLSKIPQMICVDKKKLGIITFSEGLLVYDMEKNILEKYQSTKVKGRTGATPCMLKNKLFLYGGQIEASSQICKDLLVFDIEDCTWMSFKLSGCSDPRYKYAACFIKEFLLIYGGFNSKGWMRSLFLIDLDLQACIELEHNGFIGRAYIEAKAASYENTVFILGNYYYGALLKHELLSIEINEFAASITNIQSEMPETLEEIISLNIIGHKLIVIGLSNSNIAVLSYHILSKIWQRAYFIEKFPKNFDNSQGISLGFEHEGKCFVVQINDKFMLN